MREPVTVRCQMDENGRLPQYESDGAAGMDVRTAVSFVILPGQTVLVPTGLKVAIPEGYELQVRPRSGLSYRTTLRIANAPGTIDSDYRDEIKVLVANTASLTDWGTQVLNHPELAATLGADDRVCTLEQFLQARGIDLPELTPGVHAPVFLDEDGFPLGTVHIEKGERIAQLVLCKVAQAVWEHVSDVSEHGQNRGGGFGSTGTV